MDEWEYFAKIEWKEKGLKQWPEANVTIECIEQKPFFDHYQ